ncbi:FMN-binding negative transcriptional regulator [Pedobacter sp. HMWF019]|uniref:FMN-binding negative transcriptional regulator n=1 Tax=Pedobacter sp. HMWF019 TaxID=2056856 RepID=UPI000D375CDB|nr:FMN-binding negative transcriptional regulator [Pedobacter sp. HMWF019]PTS94494.1 FMN-binding negative transcriptional regulator [Pedobacter sp. HMWF019]
MYIPAQFKFKDQQQVIDFMQRYSFATLVTAKDQLPIATHLPFHIELREHTVVLSSHFAKANPQAQELIDRPALVIFNEPHAYIAPRNYDKQENVPTWNYISVHAYGKATILHEEIQQLELMEKMISTYDKDYLEQWASLSNSFKLKMLKGIVAFEITVNDLQAQQKLSQNKTENERKKIINDLKNSKHSTDQDLAGYMKHT